MIEFNEEFISLSGGKLCESVYHNHVDFHKICDPDNKSGYDGKFVSILTFENIYDFETVRDNIEDVMYFENGGYLYRRKAFRDE